MHVQQLLYIYIYIYIQSDIIKQLRNRMKEQRKTPRKNHSATQTTAKKLEQPKKPMTSGTLIQVPPGEKNLI